MKKSTLLSKIAIASGDVTVTKEELAKLVGTLLAKLAKEPSAERIAEKAFTSGFTTGLACEETSMMVAVTKYLQPAWDAEKLKFLYKNSVTG
jgi:hypothetical protein